MEWLDMLYTVFDSLYVNSQRVLNFLLLDVEILEHSFAVYEVMFGAGIAVFLGFAVFQKFIGMS